MPAQIRYRCPECGKPKLRYADCGACGSKSPRYKYVPPKIPRDSSQPPVRGVPPLKKPEKSLKAIARALESRDGAEIIAWGRGKKFDREAECRCCKKTANPVWRYMNTSHGLAYLCTPCATKARARAKKTDAMDYRLPGSFY